MDNSAFQVLAHLESLGYKFDAEKDQIAVTPSNIPEEHVALIRKHQQDIHHILTSRAKCGGKDRLELLRRFAPKLWQMVELTDGRKGLIWGISPYGIMVSLGPKKPILTLNPEDIKQ